MRGALSRREIASTSSQSTICEEKRTGRDATSRPAREVIEESAGCRAEHAIAFATLACTWFSWAIALMLGGSATLAFACGTLVFGVGMAACLRI